MAPGESWKEPARAKSDSQQGFQTPEKCGGVIVRSGLGLT